MQVVKDSNMITAEVFRQGSTQCVRLPSEVEIEGDEVLVKRVGRSLLLIPKGTDPWRMLAESLDQFTDDFVLDRGQPGRQDREAAFE